MSGWAIVVVVAIIVWGVVEMAKARAGIVTDQDGNETIAPRDDEQTRIAAEEAQREIEQLRERIHVLERIATDNNSLDARERARISAEIEALREPVDKLEKITEDKKEESQ